MSGLEGEEDRITRFKSNKTPKDLRVEQTAAPAIRPAKVRLSYWVLVRYFQIERRQAARRSAPSAANLLRGDCDCQ